MANEEKEHRTKKQDMSADSHQEFSRGKEQIHYFPLRKDNSLMDTYSLRDYYHHKREGFHNINYSCYTNTHEKSNQKHHNMNTD